VERDHPSDSGERVGGRHIVLVGMMGSGKTVVGRALAARLGRPYLDNDDLVRERTGRDAATLLEEAGLSPLRTAEREALIDALGRETPAVVGAAAGTVLDPVVRDRLRNGARVVWLRGRPDTLAARIGDDPRSAERPRHAADLDAWLRTQAAEREPLYRAVAMLTVDVDEASPEQLADVVATALGEVPRDDLTGT
jgi:shikimate kinase